MAKQNIIYPAGEKAQKDYAINAISLAEYIYALILDDQYDPEADQSCDNLLTVGGDGHVADHLWDGAFGGSQVLTTAPYTVTSPAYTRDGDDLIFTCDDIDFSSWGTISSVGTTSPGYILMFVEDASPVDDSDRYPLFCFKAEWTPNGGDDFEFVVDPIQVARWRY